ncbi:MAG: hypothetical protein GY810_25310 [Aureispira sp.]|nr:hypothetical protein [Aureispira sp.]
MRKLILLFVLMLGCTAVYAQQRLNLKEMSLAEYYINTGEYKKLAPNSSEHKYNHSSPDYKGSKNYPKKVRGKHGFESKKLSLVVRPNERAKYQKKYDGIKLYVVNQTKKKIWFAARNNSLNIRLQAKDKSGAWKDIQYLGTADIFRDHHGVLSVKRFWEFAIPVYQGEFETKLRAVLLFEKEGKEEILYSNEFAGNIKGYVSNFCIERELGVLKKIKAKVLSHSLSYGIRFFNDDFF